HGQGNPRRRLAYALALPLRREHAGERRIDADREERGGKLPGSGLLFTALRHRMTDFLLTTKNTKNSSAFFVFFAVQSLLFLSWSSASAAPTNALASLENVHRILFLGDSITYAGQYVEDIEAYYVTRFPGRHFEFINVGLSSETVSGLSEEGHAGGKYPRPDLHERLGRILAKTK